MSRIGVELEHFILSNDGHAPSIDAVNHAYACLLGKGYAPCTDESGVHKVGVQKNSDFGLVVVKPDAFSHLLEIAFPPVPSISDFANLYSEVIEDLSGALEKAALHIQHGGCLNDLPLNYQVMASSEMQLARTRVLEKRNLPASNLAIPLFTGVIASTQVHLDHSSHAIWNEIHPLYRTEYLFPLLFSASNKFRGEEAHCVRPLIYRHNLNDHYVLTGFPSTLPDSVPDYEQLQQQSWFIKDYSLIVPRAFGTIEFRGVDSLPTCDSISQMLALRLTTRSIAPEVEPYENQRGHYYAVCETGKCETGLLETHLLKIKQAANRFPSQLTKLLIPTIRQIECSIES